MDELAAKQVLLDFEIIALITLFVGVAVFALVRRGAESGVPDPEGFDRFDLALMFFPGLLFLWNPVFQVMVAENGLDAGELETNEQTAGALFVNIAYLVFVGVMTFGIIEWVRNRRVVELFGLKLIVTALILIYTIFGGVASLVVCAWALGGVSQELLERIFSDLAAQESVQHLQESNSAEHLVLSIVMACIAAPLAEELLFRGYMYGALKRATNAVFSAVIIGALFAVVHCNLPALLPLWVFSIILCLAYEWTRCLWVPIGIHAFFNAANIVLMLVPQPGEQ